MEKSEWTQRRTKQFHCAASQEINQSNQPTKEIGWFVVAFAE